MRSDLVVIPPPGFDGLACFPQGSEPVLVQALIPPLAVEALDESILHRLPRLDEMQFHPSLVSPDIQRLACELWPLSVTRTCGTPRRSRNRSSTRTTRAPG